MAAQSVNWELVRVTIERCQLEDRGYAPIDNPVEQQIASVFKGAQPGVESDVRDRLARYVAARNAIATSAEGRLLRLSPFPAIVGSILIAAYFNIRLDLAFVGALVLPWASIHIRLKEQFETKRKELQIALWHTVHQEHGAPAAVESMDSAQPISIERFRVWQGDLVTSSDQIQAEIERLKGQLIDSTSKTELIKALQSLVSARQIVVDRAKISLFPCLGGLALFGAIGVFNESTGYLSIPHLEKIVSGFFVGSALSFVFLKLPSSMVKAHLDMEEGFNKALAYLPGPKEA